MVTKQQALTAQVFHYVGGHECKRTVGPRGGVKVYIVECRRNGATKLWKTRPHEFRVPVKYGMYEYAYVTQDNAMDWHTAEDCPLLAEQVVHSCAEHKDMEMV